MKKFILLTFLLIFTTINARADLFDLRLQYQDTFGNSHYSKKDFNKVLDIFDAYQDGTLDKYYDGFDETKSASGILNFRGIPMNLDWDAVNGKLVLNIPDITSNLTFEGSTLKQAFKKFKEYLKHNSNDLLSKILKKSISETAFDSIAGNPTSLMAQMVDNSFNNGASGFVMIAPSAAHHRIKHGDETKKIETIILPLGHTFKFANEWSLSVDLPLSYVNMDDSKTYGAQLGTTLQIPFVQTNDIGFVRSWHLLPSVRAGITGSEDSLSGGVLYMGSVTSKLIFNLSNDWELEILNMGGIVRDYALDVKGYDIEYNIRNNFFKNGIRLNYQIAEKYHTDLFFYDTQYTGSDLYIDQYDEVGFSVTRDFDKNGTFTGISFTASYTYGKHYDAYRASFALLF